MLKRKYVLIQRQGCQLTLTPSGADTFILVQGKDRDCLDYSAASSLVRFRLGRSQGSSVNVTSAATG